MFDGILGHSNANLLRSKIGRYYFFYKFVTKGVLYISCVVFQVLMRVSKGAVMS